MTTASELLALADAIAAAAAPDRELDADIAEKALGWTHARLGADADGKNDCEILTPDGKLYGGGYQYPPKGKLHRAYHVPQFTRDPLEALRFMGLQPDSAYARTILADAIRARAAQMETSPPASPQSEKGL